MHAEALRLHAALQTAGFIGPAVDPAAAHTAASPVEDFQVVILGAAMSGLGRAVQLKAASRHGFVMLTTSVGLGGTW